MELLAQGRGCPTVPANSAALQMHGAFRLIPYGYRGDLPHTQQTPARLRNQAGPVTNTTDEAVIKASWLYREPKNLPAGYVRKSMIASGYGDADLTLNMFFTGPEFEIEVARLAVTQLPIDAPLGQLGSGAEQTEAITVNGVKGILIKPEGRRDGIIAVRFVSNDVLTAVRWEVTDPARADYYVQQIIAIAQSLLR